MFSFYFLLGFSYCIVTKQINSNKYYIIAPCILCNIYSYSQSTKHVEETTIEHTFVCSIIFNFNISPLLHHIFHHLHFSSLPSWLFHSCKDLQTLRQSHSSLIVSKGLLPHLCCLKAHELLRPLP